MHDARGRVVPEGKCMNTRQSTSVCVITNMLHFRHSKNLPKPKINRSASYIVTGADCDCGRYFNIFITLPNISMTYPIVPISIMGLHSHLYGICIKGFMAVSGKEFCLFNKTK